MKPNPALKKLGFADTDRVVIIHTDDIGMCYSSVAAFADLWEFGLISSGAVMVPCPWFPKAAEYARQHPQADLGVHITLTSEWETYRWGPVSTRDPRSGMMDEQGFFHQKVAPVHLYADPACAADEIQAQVNRARAFGMQPTHMDTHMGAVAGVKLIPAYLKIAMEQRLPPLMFRDDAQRWMAKGLDAETAALAEGLVAQLEDSGLPMLDYMDSIRLEQPENRLEQAKQAFTNLKPGITHFIIHPSKDTEELRAITRDWRSRVGDYETFLSEDLRKVIREQGIQVIGYRALQALMP